ASVQVLDLGSLQGPQGDQGVQGPQGFAGYKFQYSATTTQTDPGAGFLRLNNSDLSLVTAAVIDATSAESGNPDISDEIAAWGDTGGILRICEVASEQNFASFAVTSVTDNGDYLSLVLLYRDHANGFSNNDNVSLQFTAKGETGATGASVLALDYQFNTATAGDPGPGKLLGNNAGLASITTISLNDLDRLTNNVSGLIAAFDDLGAATGRGHLYIIDYATQTNRAVYLVTGSVTDNTTYQTFAVTHVQSNGTLSNNARVALLFVPAGATGAIGGNTGAADNALLAADGAGGATLQNRSATLDDAGKLTLNLSSTAANMVGSGLKVSHATSGTPTTGIGVAIELETEAVGGNVIGGEISSVATTVTASTEDFDLVFKTRTGGALTERMRLKDDGSIQLGSTGSLALKSTGGQNLTGGYTATAHNLGSISGTTVNPSGANGQLQYLTNNGAFQINPPSADTAIDFLIVNSSNNGAITFSTGFTVGTSVGESLPTASGAKGLISIRRINSVSTYITKSLSTTT
ncbi:MAG TPA: hypothetical protein VJQ55_06390, partial [Candidatus Binatia bacterium]|nr:hypothetical protein [Candidatus Binatia bacterium]